MRDRDLAMPVHSVSIKKVDNGLLFMAEGEDFFPLGENVLETDSLDSEALRKVVGSRVLGMLDGERWT